MFSVIIRKNISILSATATRRMQESTTNSAKAAEESKVHGEEARKERPDKPIVDFEERLKEPMLPDF